MYRYHKLSYILVVNLSFFSVYDANQKVYFCNYTIIQLTIKEKSYAQI